MIFPAFACIASYLVGSIPFGYLLARSQGIDIRAVGSGNIGATNVARGLGGMAGAIVFALDFLKGALPVLAARLMSSDPLMPALAGIFALLGHMFPIWLRFQGGKGVATGAGVVFVLLPIPAAVGLLFWLATASATQFISLASVVGALSVCGLQLLLTREPFGPEARILSLFALSAFLLVTLRHTSNLARLVRGRENRLPESRIMRSLAKIIHVLSLGLWFGSNVFFTFVAAVVIFKTWETYGEMSFSDRPTWLPLGGGFNKEAGTRIAGATVAPIFPFFFLLQGICGLLALITSVAFSMQEPRRRVHRARFWIILLAVMTVIGGWPLAGQIGELRLQRYDHDPNISQPAKEQFGRLHAASLFLNFGTVGLVAIATALGAVLPAPPPSRPQ